MPLMRRAGMIAEFLLAVAPGGAYWMDGPERRTADSASANLGFRCANDG